MKKRYQFICVICLSLFLFSCSSTPPETKYFLLMNNAPANGHIAKRSKEQYSIMVEVAEYLKKPYIAMQLGDNQIHYSLFNLWAEPLTEGIQKALMFDLKQSTPPNPQHQSIQNITSVKVKIDYFHITDNSKVLLSGSYGLTSSLEEKVEPFYFEMNLKEDGFPHAIDLMRKLIEKLSFTIIKN